MFRTLVVPLDGSPLAERALPYAVRLAQASQGKLVLMRAAIAPPPLQIDRANWERDQTQAIEQAQQYLREIAERIRNRVNNTQCTVAYGRAAEKILETIDRFQADAVVMATHGRTGVPRAVLGSVAGTVLRTSNLPVVLVHPQIAVRANGDSVPSTAGPVPTF